MSAATILCVSFHCLLDAIAAPASPLGLDWMVDWSKCLLGGGQGAFLSMVISTSAIDFKFQFYLEKNCCVFEAWGRHSDIVLLSSRLRVGTRYPGYHSVLVGKQVAVFVPDRLLVFCVFFCDFCPTLVQFKGVVKHTFWVSFWYQKEC